MKLNELKESVLTTFPHLVIKDEESTVNALFNRSLRTYQEKSGFTKKIKADAAQVLVPNDCLAIAVCTDKRGVYAGVDVVTVGSDVFFEIADYSESLAPYSISYFVDLSRLKETDSFPVGVSVSQIQRHFELLLEQKNTPRLRKVLDVGKIDLSDLRSPSEITQDILTCEQTMSASRAIIPIVSARS